jgi:uncharacterized protein YjiS (DUF1127 family)
VRDRLTTFRRSGVTFDRNEPQDQGAVGTPEDFGNQAFSKEQAMFGIAGWISYDGDLKEHPDVIATMTKTMARRGLDAGGVWIDRHAGLGHRRLAVIDLAGGAQPMQAEEEGRMIASLIYTGEVYNFVECATSVMAAHEAAPHGSAGRVRGNVPCFSLFGRVLRAAAAWYARARADAAARRSASCLARLDDHTLRDIGLSREDFYRVVTKPRGYDV